MEFNVNSPVLFLLAGICVGVVLIQSVYFLVKAWRHGLAIGMDAKKLKKIAITAAVFTIAPAVSIVISVITLAKDLDHRRHQRRERHGPCLRPGD